MDGTPCELIISDRRGSDRMVVVKGGAKIFGVFRVKNHDFTLEFFFFSNFRMPSPGSAPVLYTHKTEYPCTMCMITTKFIRIKINMAINIQ